MVRPRGWHLVEKHFLVDGRADFRVALRFRPVLLPQCPALMANGTGPYFYLPKLESHHEARLWNDVFLFAQDYLGISRGTIRATVLIETILAAFEMDEILWELRDHSAGLNCGRWDYIFSFIKKFRNHPGFVLPDRSRGHDGAALPGFVRGTAIADVPPPRHPRDGRNGGADSYQERCGGQRSCALDKVREDKLREVWAGHDGTWVAHPASGPRGANPCSTRTCSSRTRSIALTTHGRRSAADLLAVPEWNDHRGGPALERRRRPPIPGSVAGRQWLRARSTT